MLAVCPFPCLSRLCLPGAASLLNLPACSCDYWRVQVSGGGSGVGQSNLSCPVGHGRAPWPLSDWGAAIVLLKGLSQQPSPWVKRQARGKIRPRPQLYCPGEEPLLSAPVHRSFNSLASSSPGRITQCRVLEGSPMGSPFQRESLFSLGNKVLRTE